MKICAAARNASAVAAGARIVSSCAALPNGEAVAVTVTTPPALPLNQALAVLLCAAMVVIAVGAVQPGSPKKPSVGELAASATIVTLPTATGIPASLWA